jgi:hypothetical protein
MAAKQNKKDTDQNFDALKGARIPLGPFTKEERAAIASLTPDEVKAIVSAKQKLGDVFIKKHVPHGMMF